MNIVILGGGSVGRFGNDFAQRARNQGHKVIIFSHKINGQNDTDQYVIDYNDIDKTKQVYTNAINDIEQIDLILLNQNGDSYPYINQQDEAPEVDANQYYRSLNIHVVSSHLLISTCHSKLHDKSKVVYMSTGLAFNLLRDNYHQHYGYGAYKSMMSNLMIGFAKNRKKKITYTVFSPHFPYDDRDTYKLVFENCYKWIFEHDDTFNGSVVAGWDYNSFPYKISWNMQEHRT